MSEECVHKFRHAESKPFRILCDACGEEQFPYGPPWHGERPGLSGGEKDTRNPAVQRDHGVFMQFEFGGKAP